MIYIYIYITNFYCIYIYIYAVEICNVVLGHGHFYESGSICSLQQYISQPEVKWVPVFVTCPVLELQENHGR